MSQAGKCLSARIDAILDWQGLSRKRLSELLDIGQTTLNKQINEGSKVLYSHVPDLLDLFPELNPDWLWVGKEPMLSKDITLPDGLREDEAMMLDYYRSCPKDGQDALRAAGSILSKRKSLDDKEVA